MRVWLKFVILLYSSIASLALAQGVSNSLGIAGTVHDTSGAAIVGARVKIIAQDGSIVAQGVTDSSGSFRFGSVYVGNYTLDVAQSGFREAKQQITLTSKPRSQLRIALSVASVKQEVTVTAPDSSPQVSTEISQISAAITCLFHTT